MGAHILSTTESDKGLMESETDFLDLIGKQHPQVVVRDGTLAFDDPVYGRYNFSEQELCTYFRHVKTMDVLWPDDDHGAAEACTTDTNEASDDAHSSHHLSNVLVAEADLWAVEAMIEEPDETNHAGEGQENHAGWQTVRFARIS